MRAGPVAVRAPNVTKKTEAPRLVPLFQAFYYRWTALSCKCIMCMCMCMCMHMHM